jgi:hypothetical protein
LAAIRTPGPYLSECLVAFGDHHPLYCVVT